MKNNRTRCLLSVLFVVIVLALVSCSPGYYRSRQFNDLSSAPVVSQRALYPVSR